MKAEIKEDGFVHITPETPAEGFALMQITRNENACGSCSQSPQPVLFDLSVIAASILLCKTSHD